MTFERGGEEVDKVLSSLARESHHSFADRQERKRGVGGRGGEKKMFISGDYLAHFHVTWGEQIATLKSNNFLTVLLQEAA